MVHLRTLRPEFVRDAFVRYKITYMSLVPMVLKNLERGLRAKLEKLPSAKRFLLHRVDRGEPRLHTQAAQARFEPRSAERRA